MTDFDMAAVGTACIFNIQKFSLHDGPGIRTTVFFKGCPLRCRWCANPESQETDVQAGLEGILYGKRYSLDEVVRVCLEDRAFYDESGGGVTLSGGEALLQQEFAIRLLSVLSGFGVHTALETSGYASKESFKKVSELSDLVICDIKHHDGIKHREGTSVDNALILDNLSLRVSEGRALLVRIPVIPGYNDSPSDACHFSELLKRLGILKVQLLPFHQFGEKKYDILDMPYGFKGQKAIYKEDLSDYADEFIKLGVDCFF